MKKIKIFDNHKIPRKYRNGYDFYMRRKYVPSCEGGDWTSKNTYVEVCAVKKGKSLPENEYNIEDCFDVVQNLCAVQICEGGKYAPLMRQTTQ